MIPPHVIARAVLIAYPSTIKADVKGFYWENADSPPARFHFETFEDAAQDLAADIGMGIDEAVQIITAGRAVA